jgi:hypothetical protein
MNTKKPIQTPTNYRNITKMNLSTTTRKIMHITKKENESNNDKNSEKQIAQ